VGNGFSTHYLPTIVYYVPFTQRELAPAPRNVGSTGSLVSLGQLGGAWAAWPRTDWRTNREWWIEAARCDSILISDARTR